MGIGRFRGDTDSVLRWYQNAEGVGFEPTKRLTPLTRFPGARTRPDYAIPPRVLGSVEEDCAVPESQNNTYEDAMRLALGQARTAGEHGDVPVGAVLLNANGEVVAAAHNRREADGDATAHAEMLAISLASRTQGHWRLDGHSLVVTLEPCPMCAMAAVWARMDRIVFGAVDFKAGGAWSLYNIPQDERLNHRVDLEAGVLADECSALLTDFFTERRT